MIRALLISDGNLFNAMIEFLLSQEEDVFTITTKKVGDNQLIKEIENIHPDIIILGSQQFEHNSHLISQLFDRNPRIRLVVVDEKQNLVSSYEKKEITITSAEDFVRVIRVV